MRLFATYLIFLTKFALITYGAMLPHQGRVLISGSAFEGTGLFRFALVDPSGAVVWNHEGGVGDPQNSLSIPVEKGFYQCRLGDTSTQGMAPLPDTIFTPENQLKLRIWFDDGTNGLQRLGQDQNLMMAPYAMTSPRSESEKIAMRFADEIIRQAGTSNISVVELIERISSFAQQATKQGTITKDMLPEDLFAEMNKTVQMFYNSESMISDLNRTLNQALVAINRPLTMDMLPDDLVYDINQTKIKYDDSQRLIYDLNGSLTLLKQTVERPITRDMLPESVRNDLNRTITKSMLGADVLADLNKTFARGSITTSMLSEDIQAKLKSHPPLSSLFMPYGYDGELIVGGSDYTVPDGKVLITSNYHGYINIGDTTVNSFGGTNYFSNDVVILPAQTTFYLVLNSSSAGMGFVGMLFDENDDFKAIYGGESYVVPEGKKLFVTSAVGYMRTNGMTISPRYNTVGKTPIVLPSETAFTLDSGPSQIRYGFTGYLVDENMTLGGGLLSWNGENENNSTKETTPGGTAPIANASITRDMLSQEVLDEITSPITSDRLSPEVAEKLNSSSQMSGQIISVPQGTSIPTGYSMISDSKIEWKMESNSNSHQQDFYTEYQGKLMSINDKLYSLYFGGSFSLRHYDENSSSWPMVENSSPPNDHGTNGGTLRDRGWGGNFGNKIFIVGGQGFNNDDIVSVYSTETGTWESGPNLPVYNSEYPPYVESIEDSLFVFSMLDSSNYRSFRLDENSSSWTEITVDYSNPVGMNWGGESISHGKLIYFIGGSSGIIQEFNSETLTVSYITTIPDWSNSVSSSDTAFILDGQIYLFRNVGHFYKYDLTKETWTRVANQPVPIGASAVYGQKMIVHKGKPWISGGSLTLVSDTANAGLSRSFGTYSGTFIPAMYSYVGGVDNNGSTQPPVGGPGSVTTSMLSDTILKYLKPEISQQPSIAGLVSDGQSVSLSAQAEGKYLTYQWKRNGNNLEGETNSTLTISDANASQHDGNYTLVVTNDFGSVETTTIPLNILVQPSTHTVDLNSSVNLEMIWVEPDTFTMGSPVSESGHDPSEEIQRNITLTKGLYLGKHEVTQAQYEAVMAGNPYGLSSTPSQFVGPNKPVEMVSWNDFQFFLFRLNQQQSSNIPAGWAYVLPTEAEWEYACRAGTTTVYSWGSDINSSRANYNWDGGGSSGNDYVQTRDVGQYAANPWGFFDMHGNVFEMVSNWRGGNLLTDLVDPQGPESGVYRLQKGGSWYSDSHELRSANQNDNLPNRRNEALGFRLAFKRIH